MLSSSGATIIFNCTINKTWSTYTPATWTAINQVACTANSQCGSGQCCNDNNSTYQGLTSTNYEPDNYCMSTSLDKTIMTFNNTVAAINFQVTSMCLNTAIATGTQVAATTTPVTTGTNTTTTGTKSGASALLYNMIALMLVLATLF